MLVPPVSISLQMILLSQQTSWYMELYFLLTPSHIPIPGSFSRKPEFNTILTASERDPLPLQAAQYSLCFQPCPPFSVEEWSDLHQSTADPSTLGKLFGPDHFSLLPCRPILAPEPLRDIFNYHIHMFTSVTVLTVLNLSSVSFCTRKTKSLHLLMLRCGNGMKPVTAAKLCVSCCQGNCIAKMCHCPLLPHPTPRA